LFSLIIKIFTFFKKTLSLVTKVSRAKKYPKFIQNKIDKGNLSIFDKIAIFITNLLVKVVKASAVGAEVLMWLSVVLIIVLVLGMLLNDISFQYVADFSEIENSERFADVRNTLAMTEGFYNRISETSFYQVFNMRDVNDSKKNFLESFWEKLSDKITFGFLNMDERLYVTDANRQPVKYLKQAVGLNTEDEEILGSKFFRDFYNKEVNFQLSPALLAEMNKIAFMNYQQDPDTNIVYPEAFTKPLHFVYDFQRVKVKTDKYGKPISSGSDGKDQIPELDENGNPKFYVYITQRYDYNDVLMSKYDKDPVIPYDPNKKNQDDIKMEGNVKSAPSIYVWEYAVEEKNIHPVYGSSESTKTTAYNNVVKYATKRNPETGAEEMVRIYFKLDPSNHKFNDSDIDLESKVFFTGPYKTIQDAIADRPMEVFFPMLVNVNGYYDLGDGVKVPAVYNNRPYRHFQLAPLADEDGNIIASSSVLVNTQIMKTKVVKDSFRNSQEYIDLFTSFFFANENKAAWDEQAKKGNQFRYYKLNSAGQPMKDSGGNYILLPENTYEAIDNVGFKALSNYFKGLLAKVTGDESKKLTYYKDSTKARAFRDFEEYLVQRGIEGYHWEWQYYEPDNSDIYHQLQSGQRVRNQDISEVGNDKKSRFVPLGYPHVNKNGEVELELITEETSVVGTDDINPNLQDNLFIATAAAFPTLLNPDLYNSLEFSYLVQYDFGDITADAYSYMTDPNTWYEYVKGEILKRIDDESSYHYNRNYYYTFLEKGTNESEEEYKTRLKTELGNYIDTYRKPVFMDKYNEVKFTTGTNVQRDKITADNFYYYIDSSGNLKQKDDSNIAMNSSGEITLNQDLVWDTRINRPVERNAASGDFNVLPMELKSVRDYGLGSILEYIQVRKVNFKSGFYFDDSYSTDRIKEYFKEKNYEGFDKNLIVSGFYPDQIRKESEFYENYFKDPDATAVFEEVSNMLIKIPDDVDTGIHTEVKDKNRYSLEKRFYIDEDGTIKDKDGKDTGIKIFSPLLKESNSVIVALFGGDKQLKPLRQFLNPLKYYLAWYDTELKDIDSTVITKVIDFIKNADVLIDTDEDVGNGSNSITKGITDNNTSINTIISNLKKGKVAKSLFSKCIDNMAVDDSSLKTLISEYRQNISDFEYTDVKMMEALFLIDEALTFAGKFNYCYQDIVTKISDLKSESKRVLDLAFTDRYYYAGDWKITLKGKEYSLRYTSTELISSTTPSKKDFKPYLGRNEKMVAWAYDNEPIEIKVLKEKGKKDSQENNNNSNDSSSSGSSSGSSSDSDSGSDSGNQDDEDEDEYETKYKFIICYLAEISDVEETYERGAMEEFLKSIYGSSVSADQFGLHPGLKVYQKTDKLKFIGQMYDITSNGGKSVGNGHVGYKVIPSSAPSEKNKNVWDADFNDKLVKVDLSQSYELKYPNINLKDINQAIENVSLPSNYIVKDGNFDRATKVYEKVFAQLQGYVDENGVDRTDRTNEGTPVPIFRNYVGFLKEIKPIEVNAYFDGEELTSWTARMTPSKTNETDIKEYIEAHNKYSKYLQDYLMNFETYIPLNVMLDSDLEYRGDIGYGKLITNTVNQPFITSGYSMAIYAEASQPYWAEIAKKMNMDENQAAKYFAQLIGGIVEESVKRSVNMTFKEYVNEGLEPTTTNESIIQSFILNEDDPLTSYYRQFSVKARDQTIEKPLQMPYLGVGFVPYKGNLPADGETISITKIGEGGLPRTLVINDKTFDISDADLCIKREGDIYLDDRRNSYKAVHYVGVKLAYLISARSFNVPEAIYMYMVPDEEFALELFKSTAATLYNAEKNSNHAMWFDVSENDLREIYKKVVNYSGDLSQIDVSMLSPIIVKDVLSYVTDFTARKQMIYASIEDMEIGGIKVGQNKDTAMKVYQNYAESFDIWCEAYGVDKALFVAMVTRESSGKADAGYPDGQAWGLAQIQGSNKGSVEVRTATPYINGQPGTPVEIRLTWDSNDERLNPNKAIQWGAAYLSQKMHECDGDIFLALQSYNMGSPKVITQIPPGSGLKESLKDHYGDTWYLELAKANLYNPYGRGWEAYDTFIGPYWAGREKFKRWKDNGRMIYNSRKGIWEPSLLWGDPRYIPHVLQYYNPVLATNSSVTLANNQYYSTSRTSAWRKFLNTIDLLVGKSYESFRNGGVKLYQRHLDYTEFVSLMNTSAGYRKNNELLSRIDYNIFDLFGGSINGDNGSGIASRDNSAVDLSEFSEINPATGEPWIYNWDEYKPPLKWSDSRVKCFTSPVGYRNLFGKNFHTGLDISADGSGVEIFPIAPGKVVFASNRSDPNTYNSGYGNYVVIAHPIDSEGRYYLMSLYAHMLTFPKVKVGDYVDVNTCLGYVGSTGNSTGTHLHLEILCKYTARDGTTYTAGDAFIAKWGINLGDTTKFPVMDASYKNKIILNPFPFAADKERVTDDLKQKFGVIKMNF